MSSRKRPLLKKSLAYGRHLEILNEGGKKEKRGKREGKTERRKKGPIKDMSEASDIYEYKKVVVDCFSALSLMLSFLEK